MSWTQANLDAIESAIASGELRVEMDGKMIIYRSIEELQKARDMISRSLAPENFTRTSYASVSRG